MATTTLVPNGDITTTGFISTGASFWTEVDEGTGSADGDTTKVNYNGQIPTTSTSIIFDLTSTPADFATPTAVSVKDSSKLVISGDDTVAFGGSSGLTSFDITASDGSTILCSGASGNSFNLGSTYSVHTLNHSGTITGSKTDWDGARLVAKYFGITSGMADTTREAHISALEVVCTYTPAGGGGADPFPYVNASYYPTQG